MLKIIQEDIDRIVESIKDEAKVLEGQTVLLSGGAGFLGTYLVGTLKTLNDKVFSNPCKIIVLDNYITGIKGNVILETSDPNLVFVEHDVRSPLPKDLEGDYIIHAAGIASPAYYRKYPIETIEVAVHGTKNFLDFAKEKGSKSMLFFSSSEIYGDPHPNSVPTKEEYWGNVSSTGPRACYDESKRLGETLCTVYHSIHNVPIKIVRPFNVFGPGMKLNDFRVIPNFMSQALKGEPLTVHDNGNQTRTFCYISDAIEGFLRVLLNGNNGEAYNVGNDEDEINMAALAERVVSLFEKPVEIKFIEYPDSYPGGEPRRRCPDLTKVKKLGYQTRVPLDEGLKRTLDWYQAVVKEQSS